MLTRAALEHVHDPDVLRDPGLEPCVQVIVDRLCLSLALSKPVGLTTWATREGRRLGVGTTCVLLDAAAQAIAEETAGMRVNHRRLLTYLDVLKEDVRQALAAVADAQDLDEAPPGFETLEALLAMLNEADAPTCYHSKATAEWARRLCVALELGPDAIEFITLCAVLHDIGKVAVPQHILLKPESLDEAEWEIVRGHPAAGQRIVSKIPSLARCALVIRAHHERFDGSGYPDRLAGAAIPFEARVLAVADSFHAMISDRPYRKAIAPRRALEILGAGAGTQWDPIIVGAMVGILGGRRAPAPGIEISASA